MAYAPIGSEKLDKKLKKKKEAVIMDKSKTSKKDKNRKTVESSSGQSIRPLDILRQKLSIL